jgi:hypothetical protein
MSGTGDLKFFLDNLLAANQGANVDLRQLPVEAGQRQAVRSDRVTRLLGFGACSLMNDRA